MSADDCRPRGCGPCTCPDGLCGQREPVGATCDGCRFAHPFPEPGPAPIKLQKPTSGFWARFWWDDESEGWAYGFAEAAYLDRVNAHENLIKCRRFPEQVTKRKADTCGEFAA